MKKLLLALLLFTAPLTAKLQFDLEPELIEMFNNPRKYQFPEICLMTNITLAWIKRTLDDNAAGRKKISRKDEQYLERISYMLCDIYNNTEYMGDAHHD